MTLQAPRGNSNNPWLAMPTGCCASGRDSLEGAGRTLLDPKRETEMQICYEQPRIVPPPRLEPIHPRPSTGHSMSQWVNTSRDFVSRASWRTSIHSLSRPRKSLARPRPSIGDPTDFRHFGGVDGIPNINDEANKPFRRRRSWTPLELSIYAPQGRLSPLPDFLNDDWNEIQRPAEAVVRGRDSAAPAFPKLIQRKPVGSGSPRSSVTSVQSRSPSPPVPTFAFLHEQSDHHTRSISSSPPPLQRASTQSTPSRILSRLPSPSRSRSNTAPSRPSSLRRFNADVDEAIRELNTIVEERRAELYRSTNQSFALINRPPPSPSHHVPAIAPALRMRVRSETLSDIGSALSAPLTSKPLPATPSALSSERAPAKLTLMPTIRPMEPTNRSLTGALTSNPITPRTPNFTSPAVSTPTTPLNRLSAWLKRSVPTTPSTTSFFKSTPSTPKLLNSTTAFYQCEPPLPPQTSTSRPTTSGSRTLGHTRDTSAETATVTLFGGSTVPSTPTLSSRSATPEPGASPPTPAFGEAKSPVRTPRRVPTPLVLTKEMNADIEVPSESTRSSTSTRSSVSVSQRDGKRITLKPPPSPNYGLLPGLELPVSKEMGGVIGTGDKNGNGRESVKDCVTPVSAVGVAF